MATKIEGITMGMRELDRVKTVQAVVDGNLKPGPAARRLRDHRPAVAPHGAALPGGGPGRVGIAAEGAAQQPPASAGDGRACLGAYT